MVLNIRKRQIDAIVKLLHFNEPQSEHSRGSEPFKILVMDAFTLKVMATLLHMEALRHHGVTLVLSIDKDREAVADAPVVYFVRATPQNVAAIAHDLEKGLYKEAHINFATWAPRQLLETLAQNLVSAGRPTAVAKVFDQYSSFIALESTLFSLGLESAYVDLNDPSANEESIAPAVNEVVEGLFSVCVTLGSVPVIRAPPGGLAEHVARALQQKLTDHLRGRSAALFSDTSVLSASATRPVLCLFDRNFDLIPMVEQPFTYKALVHDCLGMKLNKVSTGGAGVPASAAAPAASKQLSIEIGDDDPFWDEFGHQEFGVAAAESDSQLKKYQEVISSIAKHSDNASSDEAALIEEATKALHMTVKGLPALRAQKKKLDNHTNLLFTLLHEIKTRGLNQYHEMGKRILAGDAGFAEVNQMLQGTLGNPDDKLRLAILLLLTTEGQLSDSDLSVMQAALQAVHADLAAFQYVKRMRAMNLTGAGPGPASSGPPSGGAGGGLLGGLVDSNLVAGIAGNFGKQLQRLVGNTRQAVMISAVAQLMDNQSTRQGNAVSAADTFIKLDPKKQAGKPDTTEGPFKDAIVFVIGGGNYLERERLSQWAQTCTPRRSVIYGATDMLTGSELCSQLARLGKLSEDRKTPAA